MNQAIILMGVAGSGKTSVGLRLAEILGWSFFDGDDFHSPGNVTKMSKGIPLDDSDRQDWLVSLHDLIEQKSSEGKSILVACSALKKEYRETLRKDNPEVVFVFLRGSYNLIYNRMKNRKNHYMDAGMLQSQFEDLDEPTNAIEININQDFESIVDNVLQKIDLDKDRSEYGIES